MKYFRIANTNIASFQQKKSFRSILNVLESVLIFFPTASSFGERVRIFLIFFKRKIRWSSSCWSEKFYLRLWRKRFVSFQISISFPCVSPNVS